MAQAALFISMAAALASGWAGDPMITGVQIQSRLAAANGRAQDNVFNPVRDVVGYPAQRMISTQPKLSFKHPLARCNGCIRGQLVDCTRNHGVDNRFPSTVLGEPRDVYVYLPPGYDPCRRYPLVVWLHGAFGDEHAFIDGGRFEELEKLMACGKFPPAVMVCPDGTIQGRNRLTSKHSFYINGKNGAFEDFLMEEIVPWVEKEFSILPQRQAHALFGISGGGYGATSIAIRRRDYFAHVAVLAAPVNVRYKTCNDRYFANFDPATFRWNSEYHPHRVVGKYLGGLMQMRAKPMLEHAFGDRDVLMQNVVNTNPADLLFSTDLKDGEINIYLHFPGKDNFNFDAHNECFAWLAQCKGVRVETASDPDGRHLVRYFRKSVLCAYAFLGRFLPTCEPAPVDRINPSP